LNFLVVENSDLITDQSSDKLFESSDKIFVELVFFLDYQWINFCVFALVGFFNDILQGSNGVFSLMINVRPLEATDCKQEVEKIDLERQRVLFEVLLDFRHDIEHWLPNLFGSKDFCVRLNVP
jgi:hypothetical protein